MLYYRVTTVGLVQAEHTLSVFLMPEIWVSTLWQTHTHTHAHMQHWKNTQRTFMFSPSLHPSLCPNSSTPTHTHTPKHTSLHTYTYMSHTHTHTPPHTESSPNTMNEVVKGVLRDRPVRPNAVIVAVRDWLLPGVTVASDNNYSSHIVLKSIIIYIVLKLLTLKQCDCYSYYQRSGRWCDRFDFQIKMKMKWWNAIPLMLFIFPNKNTLSESYIW